MDDRISLLDSAFDAFNAGDAEAWVKLSHPEVRLGALRYELESESYEGHDGIRRFFDDSAATWEVARNEPLEYRPMGERLLVICRLTLRGRGSGAEVERTIGMLMSFRDGLIHRARTFSDLAAAEAAAADPTPFL